MKKYGREYMDTYDRLEIYKIIEPNITRVLITDGKNRGRKGVVTSVSRLNNDTYGSSSLPYLYRNYFSLRVNVGSKTNT